MTRVVEARALRRVFGKGPASRIALDCVDLTVDVGEFITVVGPSGSGKSTLLGILGGLDTGHEGTVELFGRRTRSLSDREISRLRAERIGFVFQSFCLVDTLTVLKNVLVPSLFSAKQLADRASDTPDRLSGGQRQRVAIARAIAHAPDLLLCDEPTGNLDADTADQVIEVFAALHKTGMTVVCATHEQRLRKVSGRTVYLRDGRQGDDPGDATNQQTRSDPR
jgi:putative ABC transport system ATP-binding protein